MMIWVAFGGGGVGLWEVSVLCGAGGGLTVQPAVDSKASTVPRVSRLRNTGARRSAYRPPG